MIRQILLGLVAAFLVATAASAQQPVTVIGAAPNPGNCASFFSTTQIQDAGATCGGVGTPVSQAGAYTLAGTECGKTVFMTGANAVLTVPANPITGGIPIGCRIDVVDGNTTRGQQVFGYSGITKLYPTQRLSFSINPATSQWFTPQPVLWRPPGGATFFVDNGQGNDLNDCLAAGTSACATSAEAMSDIANSLFIGAGAIGQIKWGCATTPCVYAGVPFFAKNYNGSGAMVLTGDTTTPDNVQISCSNQCAGGLFNWVRNTASNADGVWVVQGFNLSTSLTAGGVAGLAINSANVSIFFGNMHFAGFVTGGSAINCFGQATITDGGGTGAGYTISGAYNTFADIEDGCIAHFSSSVGTLVGAPAFATAFLSAHGSGSIIGTDPANFSGAASAGTMQWSCSLLGLIDLDGHSASMPGGVPGSPPAGTLSANGCYIN